MLEKDVLDKLSVIANLLALQVTKDMDKCDSAWTLKEGGMKNKEIAQVLGISLGAVSAHHSNKKKQLEEEQQSKRRGRKKNDRLS